jgi:hypothetical protein
VRKRGDIRGRPRGIVVAVRGDFSWPPVGRFRWPLTGNSSPPSQLSDSLVRPVSLEVGTEGSVWIIHWVPVRGVTTLRPSAFMQGLKYLCCKRQRHSCVDVDYHPVRDNHSKLCVSSVFHGRLRRGDKDLHAVDRLV